MAKAAAPIHGPRPIFLAAQPAAARQQASTAAQLHESHTTPTTSSPRHLREGHILPDVSGSAQIANRLYAWICLSGSPCDHACAVVRHP